MKHTKRTKNQHIIITRNLKWKKQTNKLAFSLWKRAAPKAISPTGAGHWPPSSAIPMAKKKQTSSKLSLSLLIPPTKNLPTGKTLSPKTTPKSPPPRSSTSFDAPPSTPPSGASHQPLKPSSQPDSTLMEKSDFLLLAASKPLPSGGSVPPSSSHPVAPMKVSYSEIAQS